MGICETCGEETEDGHEVCPFCERRIKEESDRAEEYALSS